MHRKKSYIYRPLVVSQSNSDTNDTQRNIQRITSADRLSLASQNTEGRFKAKHTTEASSLAKKTKNQSNKQQCMESCKCACCACSSADKLEAIEEEHQPEEHLAKLCEEAGDPLFGCCDPCQPHPTCPKCNPSTTECDPCPTPCEEEIPFLEFFDIMRCTMEDAVKKALEGTLMPYFKSSMEKTDNLAYQMKHNESMLGKIYNDLDDKISYYGERNAEQFKYLCMRMEQDQMFYQQQQECLLKGRHGGPKCQEMSADGDEEEDGFKSAAEDVASRENLQVVGKAAEAEDNASQQHN